MEAGVPRDEYEMIAQIIRDETKFLRHYIGQVTLNIDPTNGGVIQATIPELGFYTPDAALSCYPRNNRSLVIPKIGDYVEIYFMNGDPGSAVYLGIANEMLNMTPKNFSGSTPTKSVLYESGLSPLTEYVTFDDITGVLKFGEILELNFKARTIKMLTGVEAIIKGTTFDTWITTVLKILYDAHTHTAPGGGGPTTPPLIPLTAPVGHLSTLISGE